MSVAESEYLRSLRELEAGLVVPLLPSGARILEIGAGAGWQARAFSELGFDVEAIDVADSRYRGHQVFPVRVYDGIRIPFEDDAFQIVYSSNVLEHIAAVERFQLEIARVLAPGGRAVHILPTASWRVWTSLAHYPALLRRGVSFDSVRSSDAPRRPRGWQLRRMLPTRHGSAGNFATETCLFSRLRWKRLFERAGFRIASLEPNRLWYTGYRILGASLDMGTRRALSYALGSSCLVWWLERSGGPKPTPALRS